MPSKEQAFQRVESMLAEGMYQGNMHKCLRDAGRLAGGFAAAGLLSTAELDAMGNDAARRAIDPKKALMTWGDAVTFGKGQPLDIEQNRASQALSWDSPIGPRTKGIDFVEPVPEDNKQPVKDLIQYLETLYKPEDVV